MDEPTIYPLGLSREEWRAFWISLAANAVLFLAIVSVADIRKGLHS